MSSCPLVDSIHLSCFVELYYILLYASAILHKFFSSQVVYILDQVRALENEMLARIQKQGLDFTPRILIVSVTSWSQVLLI